MPSYKVNKCFFISETKLDGSFLSNEVVIESCDLIRIDRSRKGGGAAGFIKHSMAYSHKTNTSLNTGSIFTMICLPKSKPLVHILCRPPDKIDFVN